MGKIHTLSSSKAKIVKTTIYMPVELHRRSKVLAAMKGKDLNDILVLAVRLLLKIVEAESSEELLRELQGDEELLKELTELVRKQ